MNEENKVVKPTDNVAAPAPAEPAQPVAASAEPATQPKEQVVKAEVKQEAKPEVKPEAQAVVQPASEPAPQPQVLPQPASEPAPAPEVQPQPAQTPAPAPVQTVQPVQVAQPAPQPEVKEVAQAAPAPVAATPEVAPQAAAPTPPQGETIQAAPALDPIANNPQPATPAPVSQPATPAPTQTATVAPSAPLETTIDTNVGFVAVSDNLKKKKNKPLIITLVLLLLIGLGAVGYFVVYPYVVKNLAKPKVVYDQVIDNAFKKLDSTVDLVAHSQVIYDVEAQIDTNIEQIKDLNGFTYAGNFGVDPEGKNLQGGLRIKDSSNQEHSAFLYVKGDRQYLRLSSYRELIYMGTTDQYKKVWDEFYKRFESIDDKDYDYLIDKTSELVKDSIVESKLAKEDASITVNGKTYKVLNHKYTINNDTLNSMIKSVLNGLAKDDKALLILAKNLYKNEDDIKKSFNSYDDSRQLLKDDETIVINVYTYPTKAESLGMKIEYGDTTFNHYEVDGYFEYKFHSVYQNNETGKDVENNISVIGIKEDGKDNVTITYNDKEVAKLVVSSWDEKSIDFKYEVILNDQKITGAIKIDFENNDNKSKVIFNGSLNAGNDYIKISLTISNDWSSEVANINVATAKDDLSEAEIQMKLNEFTQTLKGTPLYKIVSTVNGDYLPPKYRDIFNKAFEKEQKQNVPNNNSNNQVDTPIKTTINNANSNAPNAA